MSTDPQIRILVTGSRSWPEPQRVEDALLEAWHEATQVYGPDVDVTVVHGACPTGADAIAAQWCRSTGISDEPHPANWSAHGRAAGPLRNREMTERGADLCLAFARKTSTGTQGTIRCAQDANIPVQRWDEGHDQPVFLSAPGDAHEPDLADTAEVEHADDEIEL